MRFALRTLAALALLALSCPGVNAGATPLPPEMEPGDAQAIVDALAAADAQRLALGAGPLAGRDVAARPLLSLHDTVMDLARLRLEDLLEVTRGEHRSQLPNEQVFSLAVERARADMRVGLDTVASLAGLLAPAAGRELENLLERALPAYSLASSDYLVTAFIHSARLSAEEESRPINTTLLFQVLQPVEAQRLLLEFLPPVPPAVVPGSPPLTLEDVAEVRERVTYPRPSHDAFARFSETAAETAFQAGDAFGALAYTLHAQMSYVEGQTRTSTQLGGFDLRPGLEEQYLAHLGGESSLLKAHGHEAAYLSLSSLPEGAAAAGNNAGITASLALSRYAAWDTLAADGASWVDDLLEPAGTDKAGGGSEGLSTGAKAAIGAGVALTLALLVVKRRPRGGA